jgi:hypothetical protein
LPVLTTAVNQLKKIPQQTTSYLSSPLPEEELIVPLSINNKNQKLKDMAKNRDPRPRQNQRPQELRQKPAIAPRLPKRNIHYNNKAPAKKTQTDLEEGEIAEK